ncbi:MAG: hypothetical protein MZV64_12955 [Ignavibacteriales bacterium]|nr:hypothetical protein [Ignavibacteriales bacterium]
MSRFARQQVIAHNRGNIKPREGRERGVAGGPCRLGGPRGSTGEARSARRGGASARWGETPDGSGFGRVAGALFEGS